MTPRSPRPRLAAALLATTLLATAAVAGAAPPQSAVTAPVDFFGHELGADKVLARWDRIVEYFARLEGESDRLRVVDMGPTTEGHPFLLVIISSPENLATLDRLAEVSRAIADPRGLSEERIEALIGEGKAVVSQSLGLHSTEVAGAQSGPAIAYDMVSRDDPETLRILDETIMLLLPCINPDGQVWVTDWYRDTVGTEYEGSGLPWLYHRYAGHDNNRDGDYLNLVESDYIAKVLYQDWKPQAYVDHHQMGSYGARFYVPPYSDPIRPGGDPLMWRELSWYGAHIAYKLEEAGVAGVLNAAQYPGWGHFGWHWITPYHNIAGMLTESASASLASPLYIHPDQLRGGARGLPQYEAQSNMPNPWPGGWWRVGDIVKQQVLAARAIQDLAARHRETVLRNQVLKSQRQTARGAAGETKAYVIPASQHDPLTSAQMINTLLRSDIEVQRSNDRFEVGGSVYEAGSYVVTTAQPKQGLLRNLLARTFYPDNEWTRSRDGAPLRPYDTATHTMYELMGVRVDPVERPVEADLEVLGSPVPMHGTVALDGGSWRLDGRQNASFRAVNLLLDKGVTIDRVVEGAGDVRVGDFLIAQADVEALAAVASETGVGMVVPADAGRARTTPLERARLAMYQRYRGGNMDEGWTRLVLETFDFPYTSLMDAEIREGALASKYDVIVLPHDSTGAMMGTGGGFGGTPPPVPEEYRSGLGDEGVAELKAFVEAGGTIVALGGASQFAIEKFGLAVRNVVANLDSTEFFCPGSTLRMRFDSAHPLAYGMPDDGYGLFWSSPVFQILPSRNNDDYERVATFVERDVLQSGWLIGEEHLANRAAVVQARVGEGEVVLIGIRAQHRAQTHGTFKLLFNTILR